jgi:hypothetical protein
LCLVWAQGAGAFSITVNSVSNIPNLPDAFNDGIADITATYSNDANPNRLIITLTYNDFYTGSSGDGTTLQTIGQTLGGITFNPSFTGSPSVHLASSSVMLGVNTIFVGEAAATASGELGTDVTPHWGFAVNTALGSVMSGSSMLGNWILSSIGDAGVTKDMGGNVVTGVEGVIGMGDLLGTGTPSSVEPSPPNGSPFSLVDSDTCDAVDCGGLVEGFQSNAAWIQTRIVANLNIVGGNITGILKSEPIFGTDGLPQFVIPEPGSAALLGLGLLGLLGAARRFQR